MPRQKDVPAEQPSARIAAMSAYGAGALGLRPQCSNKGLSDVRPSSWQAEARESVEFHQAAHEIDAVSEAIPPSLVGQRFPVPVDEATPVSNEDPS